jgi:hypothetical protein
VLTMRVYGEDVCVYNHPFARRAQDSASPLPNTSD